MKKTIADIRKEIESLLNEEGIGRKEENIENTVIEKVKTYPPTTSMNADITCPACGAGLYMDGDEMYKDIHMECISCHGMYFLSSKYKSTA